MTRFPDISEYYTSETALQEEAAWLLEGPQPKHCLFLRPLLVQNKIQSILEFGCGSGILAALLPEEIEYVGFDRNRWFLERARKRNAHFGIQRVFECEDVRRRTGIVSYNLSMAWSFFKHFGLHEIDDIMSLVLAAGEFCAFDVQLTDEDLDNGTAYHHTFITQERLATIIREAGHVEISRTQIEEFSLPAQSKIVRVYALWTKRVETAAKKTVGSWLQELTVDGKPATDLVNYAMRWVRQQHGMLPTLYYQGKRVSSAWKANFQIDMPTDEEGRNANTT